MRRNFLICLLLAGITLTAFWPVGQLGFIRYDDEGPQGYVVDNPNVQAGITAESIGWAFTTTQACNWHPITWLSHMLDCQLFGLKAGGHHWMNLAFHVANTLLLFILLQQLMAAPWRNALVAALFAVHPLHVQSVAWVSERKDVLSAFFFLLTLWAYMRYVQKKEALNYQPSTLNYILALIFFALGLMSKPMLVTVPVILLLLDFWPLGRVMGGGWQVTRWGFPLPQLATLNHLLFEKLPFMALSLASGVVTVWAQGTGGAVTDLNNVSLVLRFENVPVSYLGYLEKIFWPANLAIFYPHSDVPAWKVLGSALLLASLSVLCLWKARSQPYLLVGWGWFVVMLLPVIGILQVGLQSMADRYTYLPSIGIFVMVGCGMAGVASISKRWRAGMTLIGAGVLLACLLDTRHQLRFWRDSVTLSRHAIEVTGPNCLGNYALAGAFWAAGNLEEAARNYQYVVRVGPDFEEGHYYFGRVLLLQKKPGAARAQFAEVLRLDPNNPFAHKFLGDTLSAQEKFAEAEAEYQMAAQLKPGDPVIEEALDKNSFLKTLQLQPDSPEVLNNLAWLLATSQNEQTRDGAQAVRYAERACELTHHRETMMVGTLAAAYAEAGRFEEAITTAQKASALASESGQQELLAKNQELLERYRQHQPYQEVANNPSPTDSSATNHSSESVPH